MRMPVRVLPLEQKTKAAWEGSRSSQACCFREVREKEGGVVIGAYRTASLSNP